MGDELEDRAARVLYPDAKVVPAVLPVTPQTAESAAQVLYGDDPPPPAPLPPTRAEQVDASGSTIAHREPVEREPDAETVEGELYGDEAASTSDGSFDSVFHTAIGDAVEAGDEELADEIGEAQRNLHEAFETAGTPAQDLDEMMNLIGNARGFGSKEDTPFDAAERQFNETYGDQAPKVHAGIRKLVDELEKVSPGVRQSLISSGLGNSERMIGLAVREAKRRGYI